MFETRKQTGEQFQRTLFEDMEKLGFHVAVNGTEHTNPEFVKLLHQSVDQTSLAIRFQPDGVACIGNCPRSIYVEAKNAKNIERTAYEQYMKLRDAGNIVAVVFGPFGWGWNFVESLGLILGEETVGRFPPELRFPVSEHWITPRGSSRWRAVNPDNPQASGTPYREIEPSSLLPWTSFRSRIIARCQAPEYVTTASHSVELVPHYESVVYGGE